MKVLIDASCDIQYASFYIYGLYKVYGKRNVRFSSKYFKQFKHNNHFFAFVVIDHKNIKKVVVDFTDSSILNDNALSWCDVYGKINLDNSLDLSEKVVPIGPSFGIQIYSFTETCWYALANLLKSYRRISNIRKFLSDYKAQDKRPKYSDYKSERVEGNYVFFMASLWKQETIANNFRANFIKSCRTNQQIEFEGGFAPRTKNDIEGFEDLTTKSRVNMRDYITKLKQSIITFNTPAVKDCHGWKLAEYLCLGKAIISTPLKRHLPEALKNTEHLLYSTGDINGITDKINDIILNTQLKQKLEAGAKAYFDTVLAPKRVILKLTAL